MKSRKRNNWYLIALLVVILAVVVGYVLWKNASDTDSDQSNNSQQSTKETEDASPDTDTYAGWKTYSNTDKSYSIKYPEKWLLLAEDSDTVYLRNFDPTSRRDSPDTDAGGYPEGYKNIQIVVEPNDENFKAMTNGLTTNEWYEQLGKVSARAGAVTYEPSDVKTIRVANRDAKSAKAVFTETNETIVVLDDEVIYRVSLYPYGSSSDSTIKQILNSFTITN